MKELNLQYRTEEDNAIPGCQSVPGWTLKVQSSKPALPRRAFLASNLPEDEIHIRVLSAYCIGLASLEHCREMLSEDELGRLSCSRSEEAWQEFLVAHGMLREYLGAYLGVPPASVQFAKGPHGKPRVAFPDTLPIEYNIAHSHGMIALAFTRHTVLGIDIERIGPEVPSDALIETVFTDTEQEELRSLPRSQFVEGFFAAWTRKEALIKATGEGFSADLKSFSVTTNPRKPVQTEGITKDWHISSLDLKPGFALAIAVSL